MSCRILKNDFHPLSVDCIGQQLELLRYRSVKWIGLLCCLLVLQTGSSQLDAQIKHWNTGNGNWGTANNWSPNGVPGSVNGVVLGSLPGVQDSTVFLNQNATIAGLGITNGMALQTEGHVMLINGNTTLTGDSTRLNVSNAAVGIDFETNNLTIEQGSRLNVDGSTIEINGLLDIDAGGEMRTLVPNDGVISFSSNAGTALRNNGLIVAGPGIMHLLQFGNGLFDLDGQSGAGGILVSGTSDATMSFIADGLADSFSGIIDLGPNATLDMNIVGGWEADASSTIDVFDAGLNGDSRLTGSPVVLAGMIEVIGDSVDFRVDADATLAPTAIVQIAALDQMTFGQLYSTTVEGGTFSIGQNGALTFSGDTTISGGTFNTFSNLLADGPVNFNGETVWDGNVTINGIARQNGNSTVNTPTVINAGRIDMDGTLNTTWEVNSSLSVNAIGIGSVEADTFGGTFDIGNGTLAQLSVNLDDPSSFWTMAGELFVSNNLPFQSTRVSGSRLRLSGDLYVDGANVRITADTDFANVSNTVFQTAASSLVMRGTTTVEAGAMFMGTGTFINGTNGHLRLNGGASLNELGLRNQGLLEIGDATGIADVASFESTAAARWQVEIGGHVAGDEHDVLLVGNGDAILDGRLSVKLIDVGNGLFIPEVGDEFTILSTVDSVIGQFDNGPISIANGTGYQWEVLYNSNNVTLRLASTIPNLVLGDVNGDGSVDLLDVTPFVNAVTNGTYIIQADINCDGSVDLLDVSLLVALLTG